MTALVIDQSYAWVNGQRYPDIAADKPATPVNLLVMQFAAEVD